MTFKGQDRPGLIADLTTRAHVFGVELLYLEASVFANNDVYGRLIACGTREDIEDFEGAWPDLCKDIQSGAEQNLDERQLHMRVGPKPSWDNIVRVRLNGRDSRDSVTSIVTLVSYRYKARMTHVFGWVDPMSQELHLELTIVRENKLRLEDMIQKVREQAEALDLAVRVFQETVMPDQPQTYELAD